jgi:hypothetical protein
LFRIQGTGRNEARNDHERKRTALLVLRREVRQSPPTNETMFLRARSPSIDGPKWAPFPTLFWAASCATASSRPCGSHRRILKGVETPLRHAPSLVTTRVFPLPSLLLPLPTAASTIMAKRKATAEEQLARAGSNGYKRGAHREGDSTRDNGKHNDKAEMNQNMVLDRYVL